MFSVAILIGIYSYIIFSLGLTGYLYKQNVISVTIIYSLLIFLLYRQTIFKNLRLIPLLMSQIKKSKLMFFLVLLILVQALVNFIGVLGPELSFDALWYHLTLPKIYLQNHAITHISGGLLYYSDMPKLTEMFYVAGLAFGSEIFAKFIHFSFGILSLVALYNLSRKFLSKTFSFLVIALFYSNLVVGWMSITAYVDLARTFFEIMALWGFVEWQQSKKTKWLIDSAVMLGLAISVKLLALGSIFIFTFLIILNLIQNSKFKFNTIITNILVYWWFAFSIPLPWFVLSLVHTGNPLYPFFTDLYSLKFNFNLINPLSLSDPISPLYVIFLPLAVFFYRRFKPLLKIISLYSVLAIVIWYLTPQTGGGRFILPYLPALSILSMGMSMEIRAVKTQRVVIGAIILISLFSLIYRFGANLKYIPVVFGKESKAQFLSNHLNFSFGDFYDTDGFFKTHIKNTDTVLLYGFHNLYYTDFPFIDSSWVKRGNTFNYIAVQNTSLPKRFSYWNLIYYNSKTHVKLYSLGGQKWAY